MGKGYKRLFVGSDSHCGHRAGLTPPDYQSRKGWGKWEETQKILWDFYADKVAKWQPYDIAILAGDLVDGKGVKSGSSELITADRFIQAEISYKAFSIIKSPVVRIAYGTPYHTGASEDYENKVCDEFLKHNINCKAEGHGFYDINGKYFDVKHKINGSSVHHGKATPLLKQIDDNLFWSAADIEPKADVIIRAHVHKSMQTEQDFRYGFITPGLTGLGDKYGSRQCSGVVEFGFWIIDVPDDRQEQIVWRKEILPGKYQRTVAETL